MALSWYSVRDGYMSRSARCSIGNHPLKNDETTACDFSKFNQSSPDSNRFKQSNSFNYMLSKQTDISSQLTSISLTLTPLSSSSGSTTLSKSFILHDLDFATLCKSASASKITSDEKLPELLYQNDEPQISESENTLEVTTQKTQCRKWQIKDISPDTIEHFWHSSCESWCSWDPTLSSSPSVTLEDNLAKTNTIKSKKRLALLKKFDFDMRTFDQLEFWKKKAEKKNVEIENDKQMKLSDKNDVNNILEQVDGDKQTNSDDNLFESEQSASGQVIFSTRTTSTTRSNTITPYTLVEAVKSYVDIQEIHGKDKTLDKIKGINSEADKISPMSPTILVEEDEEKGTKLIVKREFTCKQLNRPEVEFHIANVKPRVERLSDATLHRLFYLPNAVITPLSLRSNCNLGAGGPRKYVERYDNIDLIDKISSGDHNEGKLKQNSEQALNKKLDFSKMLLYLFD